MSDIIVNLDINNTGFNVKIRDAERLLNQFSRSFGGIDDASRRTSASMNSMLATFRDFSVAAYAVQNAVSGMKMMLFDWQLAIVETSAKFEKMGVLLGGLSDAQTQYGRNRDAQNSIAEMLDLARQAPFSFDEMTKSLVKFRAVDLSDPERMLRSLVNAVAAFGGSEDEIHRASVAIMQMAGKGVISMEELRQQLGEAVPSAVKTMARELGMSYGKLVAEISKGNIDAATGLNALTVGWEKDFDGAAARMMNTWSGLVSQLKTEWQVFQTQIGKGNADGIFSLGLFDQAKASLKDIVELLRDADTLDFGRSMGDSLAKVIARLEQMVRFAIENRDQIAALTKASLTFFEVWLGAKGISWLIAKLGSLNKTLVATSALLSPQKLVAGAIIGGAAYLALDKYNESLDGAVKSIDELTNKQGPLGRALEGISAFFRDDFFLDYRISIDRVSEGVDDLAGSFQKLGVVKEARGWFSDTFDYIQTHESTLDDVADKLAQFGASPSWGSFSDALRADLDVLFESLSELPTMVEKLFASMGIGAGLFVSVAEAHWDDIKVYWQKLLTWLGGQWDETILTWEMALAKFESWVATLIDDILQGFAGMAQAAPALVPDFVQNWVSSSLAATNKWKSETSSAVESVQNAHDDWLQSYADGQQILDADLDATSAKRASLNQIAHEMWVERMGQIDKEREAMRQRLADEDRWQEALKEEQALYQASLREGFLQDGPVSADSIAEMQKYNALLERTGTLQDKLDKQYASTSKLEKFAREIASTRQEYALLFAAMDEANRKAAELNQPIPYPSDDIAEQHQREAAVLASLNDEIIKTIGSVNALSNSVTSAVENMREQFEALAGSSALSKALEMLKQEADKLDQSTANGSVSDADGIARVTEELNKQVEARNAYTKSVRLTTDAQESLARAQSASVDAAERYAEKAARALSSQNDGGGSEAQVRRYTAAIAALLPQIDKMSEKYGVAREVILAVMETESQFSANAKSPAGAIGLMQLMPKTAADLVKQLGGVGGAWKTNVNDNIELGVAYLRQLIDMFHGDLAKAVAAYNSGPGNAMKGIVPEETRKYVPQVTNNLKALNAEGVNAGQVFSGLVKPALQSTDEVLAGVYHSSDTAAQKLTALSGVTAQLFTQDTPEVLTKDITAYSQSLINLAPLMAKVMDYQTKMATGGLSPEQIYGGQKATEQLNRQLKSLDDTKENLVKRDQELLKSGQEQVSQIKLTDKQLNDLADRYDTTYSAQRTFREDADRLAQLYEKGRISLYQYNKELENLRLNVVSTQGPFAAWMADLERSIPDFQEFGADLMDSFTDSLADGLADGRLEFKDFVDDVKKMLAEIVAKKIVLTFVGAISGISTTGAMAGASGAASSMASGASPLSSLSSLSSLTSLSGWSSLLQGTQLGSGAANMLSWFGGASPITGLYGSDMAGMGVGYGNSYLNNLAGISNWQLGGASLLGGLLGNALFNGKYSGTGSAFGSTAGSVVGSLFGPVGTWLGGLLGGAAGGWIGSLFGNDEPRMGGYATSFSGKGFEDGVSSQGAFGLQFGVSDKGSKNIDASQYQSTLDGLAQVSQALSGFYGSDISASIQNSLRTSLSDFNDWGGNLDQMFQQLFNAILSRGNDAIEGSNDVGSALAMVVEQLGGLSGSAETMANRLQTSMQIVASASALLQSGFKDVLGLEDDLTSASSAMTYLLNTFSRSGDDVSATLTRIITSLALMESALIQTGKSLSDVKTSAEDLVTISESLTDYAYMAGVSYSDLAALQAAFYSATRSEAEQAKDKQTAAMESIKKFNDVIGNTSGNLIDSTAELRAFVESLDLQTESGRYAYVQAMLATSSFVALEEALASLTDAAESVDVDAWVASLAPDTVAFDVMLAKFAEWGVVMPATSDALYNLIIAGKLTDEQMTYLAQHTDELGAAFSAIADLQSALVDRLQSEYDAAKNAASDASDAILSDLRDAYDQTVSSINDQISGLGDTVSDLQSTIGSLESTVDSIDSAIRGLTTQMDGIDETRQRLLDEAAAATASILAGGAVPRDVGDIISGLSTVDPNDFATRAEYEAAVQENLAALESLKSATAGQLTEAEKQLAAAESQIDLLQKQLDQEKDLYDDAVAAEKDRLAALLADLDDQFAAEKKAIESAAASQLVELSAQTTLLGKIAAALQDVTAGATPAFAAGGRHAGGWRIVGEEGPELEYTGPSTILPSRLTSAILSPSSGDAAASEVRALRAEIRELRAVLVRNAADTAGVRATLGKWDGQGMPADREDYAKTVAEAAA